MAAAVPAQLWPASWIFLPMVGRDLNRSCGCATPFRGIIATLARLVPFQPYHPAACARRQTFFGETRPLVPDPLSVGDSLKPRLQLCLGVRAELGDEILGAPGCRAFAGLTRADRRPVIVTLHSPPPAGPDPAALRDCVARLRGLEHGLLDLPLVDGDLDGRAWILDAVSSDPAAFDRLNSGPLPLAHGVSAIRDLARAVAASHRQGIVHGAINLDTVRITADGARLGGIGHSMGGSVRGDLDALGEVAWALLSGEVLVPSSRPLSAIRRGVAPSLDALCLTLRAPDPRDRPQRAEAILDALDAVPTRRANPLASIVDVGLHDGRPRRAIAWLVVGAAVLLLLALLQSRA